MIRFHQNRLDAVTRERLAETVLSPADFIQVFFLVEGAGILEPVAGLAGTAHLSPDRLAEAARPFLDRGISRFLLFGSVDQTLKSPDGRAAWVPDALVARGVASLKRAHPSATVMTDVCLCAYTTHGHCGLLSDGPHGQARIDNDATLPLLAAMARRHAEAGADWVAPSAMMDGQVAAIRRELDAAGSARDGGQPCRVLGYSAKFASAFYGPFRGAADSSPQSGDRKTYQMDWRNGREALEEVAADLAEAADAVMVKPALSYLDVLARSRDRFPDAVLAAYHTSGEFMGLRAAARAGVFPYRAALAEQLTAIKRAGANWIIGYAVADFWDVPGPWTAPRDAMD
jgi:porphobilinogen synthase